MEFKMELVGLSDIILIETILILIRSRFLEIIPLKYVKMWAVRILLNVIYELLRNNIKKIFITQLKIILLSTSNFRRSLTILSSSIELEPIKLEPYSHVALRVYKSFHESK